VYGYPKDDAAQIAVDVMHAFEKFFDEIIACCYSTEDKARYQRILSNGEPSAP